MARRSRSTAPAGDVVLNNVRRRLRQGWPPGVTVLTGDDLFHLDAAQKALLESLVPPEASDFAFNVVGQEPVDVSSVVAAARSRPMFAPRRVVLVRDIGALQGEPEPLSAYAKQPPPDSFLLVRAPELDRRRRLHKTLIGAGTVLTFSLSGLANTHKLLEILIRLAGERGLTIDRGAAQFLIEVCGTDLYRLSTELDKLRSWLGVEQHGKVTLQAVQEVCAGSGMMSGWELADAVLMRDPAAAAVAARRLVERGDEPIRILGGLASRARAMLQAKAMLQRGLRGREVIDGARAWAFREKLFDGLERYTLSELMRFPALLLQADRTLKSRSIDPRAVLESLAGELTSMEGAGAGTR